VGLTSEFESDGSQVLSSGLGDDPPDVSRSSVEDVIEAEGEKSGGLGDRAVDNFQRRRVEVLGEELGEEGSDGGALFGGLDDGGASSGDGSEERGENESCTVRKLGANSVPSGITSLMGTARERLSVHSLCNQCTQDSQFHVPITSATPARPRVDQLPSSRLKTARPTLGHVVHGSRCESPRSGRLDLGRLGPLVEMVVALVDLSLHLVDLGHDCARPSISCILSRARWSTHWSQSRVDRGLQRQQHRRPLRCLAALVRRQPPRLRARGG
jgi:hypothetical protein